MDPLPIDFGIGGEQMPACCALDDGWVGKVGSLEDGLERRGTFGKGVGEGVGGSDEKEGG